MPIRCLIVDHMHENIGPLLKAIDVEYDYQPNITREEIKVAIAGYDGLMIRSKTKVDEDLLAYSSLKFIARPGSGIDNLDQDLLDKRGIKIFNAPEGNRDAVAEHTIGFMLNLLHNLTQGHNQVVAGKWDREGNRGFELGSLTVGIYGYGNTGSTLAKKLTGFGCQVIAYDKYLDSGDSNADLLDLDTFFEKTQILSLHIPLTAETNRMADTAFFNRFRKQLIFLNTSRGEIAPLADIMQAIETEQIKMAALDVLECEKLNEMNEQQTTAFNWLKNSGKVIFTPHVAGWTAESHQRLNAVLVEKIGAFLDRS
jgi:D-3-phosphoglycerate dehydrogenase / 2-oxoglutarate reductase